MAYSSYSNGLNVQATPSRDRDRHPFPQSTHPSPGPSLRQSSTSSASNSATHLPSTAGVAAPTPSMSTHTVLTTDHFLKQHSPASNPALAALEQAVADRNVLSGQNTQLWKLIEKQRAGYNQILKELERIRGERDSYKGRLAALSALPPSTDKRQNNASTSTSNTTGAVVGERGSRPSIDTISSQMSSNSSGVSQPQQRQLLPRQYSDGTPSTAAPRNGTHQLHSSRSLDPITSSANHGSGNNSDSGLITTPRRSNSPSPLNVASSRQHRAPPAPLVVPGHEDNHAAYTISHSPESAISTRQPGGGYEAGSAGSQGGGAGYATTTTTRPPDSPSTATPKPQGQSQAQMQAAAYPRKSSLADSISSVVTGSSILSLSSGSSHFYGSQANMPQQQPQSNYTSPPPPSAPPVLENPFARAGSGASGGVNTRALGPTSSSPAIIQASSSGSTSGNSVNGNTPSPLAQPPYVPQQQQQQQPLLDTRSPPHFLSRDSRISLPDEASRYIQNMSDSPAASPRTDVFPAPRSKLSNTVFPPQSMDPLARESEFLDMDDDAEEDGHGEGSEDGSEDGDEIGGEADTTAGADNPGFDSSSTTTGATRSENNNSTINNTDSEGYSYPYPHAEYMNNYSSQSNSSREDIIGGYGSGSGYSGGRKDNKSASSSRVGIDEFPLPPPSNPYHQRPPGVELAYNSNGPAPSQQGYQQQQQQGQSSLSTPSRAQAASGAKQGQAGADQSYHYNSSGAHSAGEASHLHPTSMQDAVTAPGPVGASPYLTPPAMQQPSVSSSSSISSSNHQQPQSQSQSQSVQKPAASTASFRALPLISTDLPHTTITVSHSFVRPNDRGKEVLSFIVFVNPGSGKEGWKVEKMYSDVLSLDQRVRNSVGKAVVKKIMTLPEGKLWKDHAPAKVDQRKAVLETYLQSLIQLPVKNNDEVIAFFTTDIIREQKQAVMQVGHKEGYLTKKGKNFGGWKTRFFVLQGPVLEYYDCRGGAHLGSIMITGAQIARQHRTERAPNADDETEYRHAFLIVESKKGPGGNHPRHVLCAESDDDRDSWVEMLVRYYTGTYSEDLVFNPASGLTSVQSPAQPRASTSSNDVASRTKPTMARGDTKGSSISLAASDDFLRSSSPSSRSIDPSPVDRQGPSAAGGLDIPKRAMDRSNLGLPSSLPDSSPLSAAQNFMQDVATTGQRANSEQGHYPDLLQQQSSQDSRRKGSSRQHSPEQHRQRSGDDSRKTFQPSLSTVNPSPTSAAPPGSQPPERVPSPEKPESKVKISGPMNGTPIPSGFKFGGKDAPSSEQAQAASDRREKAKSRSFWGFGKMNGDKAQAHANFPPRAVFGVTLEDALEVSQICNLPAIVFRCIQYLEAKKADQEEGIYRLSGSSAVIKNLKDMFNNEGDIDLLASDEYWDPHAIAGLLKSFLRELPSSILTRDLHLKFLAVIDIPDAQERIRELSHLIAALPLANYSLLRALTAHLILIVQNAPINKMTMRNVGIVFSPTLGIPAGVFSLMLGEFNRVFNVDGDGAEAEGAGGAAGEGQGGAEGAGGGGLLENPVSELKRNSRQYTDAAADQMLGLGGRTLKKSTADETHSDVGDSASMIDHDESGTDAITITTESADAPGTVESSATSASPASNQETDAAYDYNSYDYESSGITVVPPAAEPTDAPVSTQATPMKTPSKASTTAANRGLNVTVTMSERGNRHSRMIGLPASPRPTTTSTSMSGMAQTASGSSGDAHTTDS